MLDSGNSRTVFAHPRLRHIFTSKFVSYFHQVERHTLEISEMKALFRKRAGEFETIRDGMRTIEEFQTRKAQMEQELSDVRGKLLFIYLFKFPFLVAFDTSI